MHNENPNEKASRTQCRRILACLMSGETITSLEAVKRFQTLRLASRIHDLRASSDELFDDIRKVRVKDATTGKQYDAYYSAKAIEESCGILFPSDELVKQVALRKTMNRINN